MKIVIDTNVIVSAMFFGGKPRQLVELLVKHKFQSFASAEIVNEYQDTASELCARYPKKPVHLPLTAIVTAMNIIETTSDISVCRDPDDDKFINCALDSNCSYIISGDNDLLTIKNYNGIKIVTVAEFFHQIAPSPYTPPHHK